MQGFERLEVAIHATQAGLKQRGVNERYHLEFVRSADAFLPNHALKHVLGPRPWLTIKIKFVDRAPMPPCPSAKVKRCNRKTGTHISVTGDSCKTTTIVPLEVDQINIDRELG